MALNGLALKYSRHAGPRAGARLLPSKAFFVRRSERPELLEVLLNKIESPADLDKREIQLQGRTKRTRTGSGPRFRPCWA